MLPLNSCSFSLSFFVFQLKCCGWTKAFNTTLKNYPTSCDDIESKNITCKKLHNNYVANTMLAAGWFCVISVVFPMICAVTTAKMATRIKGYFSTTFFYKLRHNNLQNTRGSQNRRFNHPYVQKIPYQRMEFGGICQIYVFSLDYIFQHVPCI